MSKRILAITMLSLGLTGALFSYSPAEAAPGDACASVRNTLKIVGVLGTPAAEPVEAAIDDHLCSER